MSYIHEAGCGLKLKTVSKREPWHRSHLLVGQTFHCDRKSVSSTVLLWIKGSSFSMNLGFSEATPRVTFRKTPRAGALPLPWNILILKKNNNNEETYRVQEWFHNAPTKPPGPYLLLTWKWLKEGSTDRTGRRTRGEDARIPINYHLNNKINELRQRLLTPTANPNGVKDKITIHSR